MDYGKGDIVRDIVTELITLILVFVLGFASGVYYTERRHAEEVTGPLEISRMCRVTAYCRCSKCCGQYADGITASGHVIKTGDKFVAAPSDIKFGTIIDVPGYGRVPVLDRGGSIKGNRLDVFFDGDTKKGLTGHEQALQWGIQYLTVRVYLNEQTPYAKK